MYSVLIVDDEEWVVESLKNGIAWADYGFVVVDHAYDGAEALEKVRKLRPDLVFTDIRMPVMGGLDLIRQVRRDKLQVEFVVVSGYAEFAYAQKALHYGVMGFCLKPAEDAEVNAVLARIQSVLDHRHSVDEETAEEMVRVAEGHSDDDFADRLTKEGFVWDSGPAKLVLARRGRSDVLKLAVKPSYTGLIGLNYRIWILGEHDYQSERDAMVAIATQRGCVLGRSRGFSDRRGIDRAVQEAIVACNQLFMMGPPGLYEYPQKPDTARLRTELGHLGRAIADTDRSATDRAFDSIVGLLKAGFTVKHASFVYNAVHYMISVGGIDDREPIYHFEELLGVCNDVDFMIDFLKETVSAHLHDDLLDSDQHVPSAVDKAIEYVDMNLFDDISLKALASKFFVSPSHLCRMFKRATGEPLTQYITKKRIESACSLLAQTELPISEIAEKSGYENYFYFARVFKRIMGKTPTEYRLVAP
jgi:two-component system, response regulator YesN